jgi:hypothetical protein
LQNAKQRGAQLVTGLRKLQESIRSSSTFGDWA